MLIFSGRANPIAKNLAVEVIAASKKLQLTLQEIDTTILLGFILYKNGQFDEALITAQKAENELLKFSDDSSRKVNKLIGLLNNLFGSVYSDRGELDNAIHHFEIMLNAAVKINHIQVISYALNNLAVAFERKGEYDRAIETFENCLKIKKEIGNEQDIGMTLNNIASVYSAKGQFIQAIDYLLKAFSLFAKTGHKNNMVMALNNLTLNYKRKGDLESVLKYAMSCLEIHEELGNEYSIAIPLNNISGIYQNKGDFEEALNSFKKSLTLFQKLKDKNGISHVYHGMGNIYCNMGELDKSLEYYSKSLKLREEIGNQDHIAIVLSAIGNIYRQKGKLSEAMKHLDKSLSIMTEIGNKQKIASVLEVIGKIHLFQGYYDKALEIFNHCLELKEEIGNNIDTALTLFYLIFLGYQQNLTNKLSQHMAHLEYIKRNEQNIIIDFMFELANALLLKTRNDTSKIEESKLILMQLMKKKITNYELKIISVLTLTEILLEQYVVTGDKNFIIEIQEHLMSILSLAKKEQLKGVELTSLLLQGKIHILQVEIDKAKVVLQEIQNEATKLGYDQILKQSTDELEQLTNVTKIEQMLLLTEEKSLFNKQQISALFSYLKEFAIQI